MRSILNRIYANVGKIAAIITGLGVISTVLIILLSSVFAKNGAIDALKQEDKRIESMCLENRTGIDTMRMDIKYLIKIADENRKMLLVLSLRDNTRTGR